MAIIINSEEKTQRPYSATVMGHISVNDHIANIHIFFFVYAFAISISSCFANWREFRCVSKLFCLSLALPFECSHPYYPYTIDIVYKDHASSQAIEVYQIRNNSVAWITSLYGYGKDNLIERTNLCLKSGLYQFVCSSR